MSRDGDIISNDNFEANHGEILKTSLAKSERVLFASPFLTEQFEQVFPAESCKKLEFVHLVTTCRQRDWEQVKKRRALTSFIRVAEERNFQYKISIDDELHGKVYLFQKGGKDFAGIVTSANLTTSGMGVRREYGSIVKEGRRLALLRESLTSRLRIENFTKEDLEDLGRRVDDYLLKHGAPIANEMDLDGTPRHPATVSRSLVQYWIKPIGTTEDPVSKDHIEDMASNNHYFSKTAKNIQIGDILVIYAVGTRKIVTCYEVTSAAEYISETHRDEMQRTRAARWRWMWMVSARNLSCAFGRSWFERDMLLKSVASEYQKEYGRLPLTHNGATDLEGLKHGPDRLRLDPLFGEYIRRKVVESR